MKGKSNMKNIITSIVEWQTLRKENYFAGKTVGLVPTMGNLHEGHRSLLKLSVQENNITVLSIFVNPTQFNNLNDLQHYPRTFEHDVQMAREVGVDFILAPEYHEIYPDDYRYKVCETGMSTLLCGKHRPGHFDGVLTVVLKLLLLTKPHRTYFGEKDYQQLKLVEGMVKAFFLDTKIIACKTIRDSAGLALSSRNHLLTSEQFELAQMFAKLLSSGFSTEMIVNKLTEIGFDIDYIEEHFGRRFGAVKLGNVRLIDNIELK